MITSILIVSIFVHVILLVIVIVMVAVISLLLAWFGVRLELVRSKEALNPNAQNLNQPSTLNPNS